MTSSLVSILMPAFNAEKFIAEAIGSILKQDYANWELLVLDDASSDSTKTIIEKFEDARIKVFSHSENRGYLISCNELFWEAKGEFITFLDADDSCPANRLSSCLKQFELNPELDFLSTDYQRITEIGKLVSKNTTNVDYYRYAADSNCNPTICCATVFLKKQLLEKVGGYRPFFMEVGGEDYYWLWELSCKGSGMHLNQLLYDYRIHPKQTSVAHKNDVSLFLPELMEHLRTEFKNSDWEYATAERTMKKIEERFVQSPFQLHLRKAQQSLNRHNGSFWKHAFVSFIQIRTPNEFSSFVYLLHSWMFRNLRNADQST